MMKRITLMILLVSSVIYSYATTWTITNVNFTFSPETLTIQAGDDVKFTIANIHQVAEVSQATWNANGNTQLSGGFSTPAGGGPVSASKLTVGTHWYVCVPHASGGMKGIIIVQPLTATEEITAPSAISIYPNPSTGKINLSIASSGLSKNYNLAVYNIFGQNVYSKSNSEIVSVSEIDLSNLAKGVYFIRVSDGTAVYTRKVLIQ